jgi:poly-gamma-glutamate synthesis protein (capsule biosynthesis protein)
VTRSHRRPAAHALVGLLIGVAIAAGPDPVRADDPMRQQRPSAQRERHLIHFTISVSGDLLIHPPVWEQALANGGGGSYDFAPMFRRIRPYVAGVDLGLCHVETPMTSAPPSGYPTFNTPPALARGVSAAGWDACDTASNHSLDQGQAGIEQTGAALDRAHVKHTGSFDSRRARRGALILDVKGVKVGFVAYTDFTNGIPPPHPWSVNLAPVEESPAAKASRILADAKRARKAGADAVIVNLHWGDQYLTEPNPSQLALARRLMASPLITAIVGQGPHVVQPIRRIGGKFVVFSEGNLVSEQGAATGYPAETQYGLIALLRCAAGANGVRVVRVAYVPTWVRHSDYVVLPVVTGLKDDRADVPSLRTAYRSTVAIVGRRPRVRPIPRKLPLLIDEG